MKDLVKRLEDLSPRYGKKEKEAFKLILQWLEGIDIEVQSFKNSVPVGDAKLTVDGEEVECLPSSFVSGRLGEKCIVSSVHTSPEFFDEENINFNPYSKEISLVTFYFSPSVAVRREDVGKIATAEVIKGRVRVRKERYSSKNILVGNLRNPRYLVFCHYDTILSGAVDNSSGVSVCIELVKNYPEILSNVLVVFSGSEELSYDNPVYWGKGYRVFEEEFRELLKNCKAIFVVDCVGFAPAGVTRDEKMLFEVFPVKSFDSVKQRLFLISVKEKYFKEMLSFYHSRLDVVDNLKESYMKQALNLLVKNLKE